MKVRDRFVDLDRYVFTFGKNRGRLIQDVIEDEASYVVWCHKNVESFVLSDKDYQEVLKEMDRQGNSSGVDHYEHDWMGGYNPWDDIGDIGN